MYSIKEIKKHNPQSFLDALKSVYDVMVYCGTTQMYFKITKSELLKEAQSTQIYYRMRSDIFKNGRLVMVII